MRVNLASDLATVSVPRRRLKLAYYYKLIAAITVAPFSPLRAQITYRGGTDTRSWRRNGPGVNANGAALGH